MTDTPHLTTAFLTAEQTGQTVPLDQELLTIGRKSGNTIVLAEDLKVSRHHANIVRQDDHYVVQDVGSANGTFLNDERLTEPKPLKDGDVIQLGDSSFTVHLPLPDTQPSPRPAAVQQAGMAERCLYPRDGERGAGSGRPAVPAGSRLGGG